MALLCVLTACSGQIGASADRGPDVLDLIAIESQAEARAQEIFPDALLRQVDLGRDPVRYRFHFTNAAATQGVVVKIPVTDAPSVKWEVAPGSPKLLGHPSPGFNLERLRVGPAFVVKAATRHWEGCPVRGLSLHGVEDTLTWYIFCNLPKGVVSAMVDGVTGEFTASLAPPAFPPPTATPNCGQDKSVPDCLGLSLPFESGVPNAVVVHAVGAGFKPAPPAMAASSLETSTCYGSSRACRCT